MDAYFAGGCFWCMAKPYHEIPGVKHVESGFCGGKAEDAVYERVKAQETAHRETVRVSYDPAVVSYAELLDAYLYNIDPFDDGGQFIDRGHSYTCAIYCTDDGQRAAAEAALHALEVQAGRSPSISVEPFSAFYPAEEYHQDFAEKNPEAFEQELEASGRAAFLRAKAES